MSRKRYSTKDISRPFITLYNFIKSLSTSKNVTERLSTSQHVSVHHRTSQNVSELLRNVFIFVAAYPSVDDVTSKFYSKIVQTLILLTDTGPTKRENAVLTSRTTTTTKTASTTTITTKKTRTKQTLRQSTTIFNSLEIHKFLVLKKWNNKWCLILHLDSTVKAEWIYGNKEFRKEPENGLMSV